MEMLTYEELSALLKVPKGTLYAWVSEGRIPHIRLGKRTVRFERGRVLDWLQAGENDPEKSKLLPFKRKE